LASERTLVAATRRVREVTPSVSDDHEENLDDPAQDDVAEVEDWDDVEPPADADDDWFDRALSDAEESGEDLFSGDWSPSATDDAESGDSTGSHDESSGPADAFERDAGDLDAAFDDIADDETEFDADAPATPDEDAADDDDEWSFDGDDQSTDGDQSTDDGGLFDQDFGSALSSAPDLPGDSGGGPADGGGASAPGGGGSGDVLGSEFDMATDDVDALGDMGGAMPPGGGGGGFSGGEDDYESEVSRIELGVEGLDAMIQGGVPQRSLMVAIGSAGTGKTTLGLQFLECGLQEGERAVYITLEETRERVIRSATEKGFPFDEYADDGRLAVVDIDPVEMANSLQSIRSELPRLVSEFGASRLVLDSVSLLEMMYDNRATRRNEIYDFTKSLKEAGVTTLMTSEASEDSAYASRHGIVEYLTDAVFVLQYVRPSDFRETRLAIEIQKIRDANHSRETKPYEITGEGISVYRQANIF
jgi:KaiC domain protein